MTNGRLAACPSHGPYRSRHLLGSIWSKCPVCAEERDAAEREAEARRRAEVERQRLAEMLETAAIPRRFQGRGFDNFHAETPAQRRALEAARDYARQFGEHLRGGKGLVFAGLPGTGKSHLAGAILQAILPAHVGLYTTCMGLIRAIRATWRRDAERSEAELLREFGRVPLLVIDEVGVQYGTDGEQTILFDVLDRRYRDAMPTLLLTNQDREGLKQCIGARAYDRVRETASWVTFNWPSHRLAARQAASPFNPPQEGSSP
ncbi:ATP-binding protein [Aquabacterium sp. A7-Y]|uniref:ATP-binding protein n=1 Tax=Aquabacterium sp. A7-Y TaxID=1349605 RepID=UPI00223DBDAB|nr:ATP-binding protein [Aquabacterium sp. A7-Y]MCW7541461.1 ATP-binding protein [Aquabacterium sp. A7-Y]